jgi:hypothetical protein
MIGNQDLLSLSRALPSQSDCLSVRLCVSYRPLLAQAPWRSHVSLTRLQVLVLNLVTSTPLSEGVQVVGINVRIGPSDAELRRHNGC